jgi:asparagine synthase (glutamine-hydrolysing)
MCGIAGFIDFNNTSDRIVLQEMVQTLDHRGPDDFGAEVFSHTNCTIGFSQSRLSIIDLSQGGHQPMHLDNLSVVFNGEIYNYKEIKSDLVKLGHNFQTGSDTEVILHAYQQWGTQAVKRFIGMFAIVIFDREKNKVVFIRDRAGVKPFYVYAHNGVFLFASELKAFHPHPKFQKEIHQEALVKYMQYGYIPSPLCIFKNTYKLEPGCIEEIDLNTQQKKLDRYWSVASFYKKDKLVMDYHEAKEELLKLFKSAFNYRMISDVPVGVFLSGGYDSTLVASVLQAEQSEQLKTFTIGFEEGNNEAPYAKETAAYLGTDHTEHICTTKEAQEIIPELPTFYDEPFGDSSAIPTTLVSRVAKQQVTVALSADAGDEVFAGYNSYQALEDYLKKINSIPAIGKSLVAAGAGIANKLVSSSSLSHKLAGLANGISNNPLEQSIRLYTEMGRTPRMLINGCFDFEVKSTLTNEPIDYKGYTDIIDPVLSRDYIMYLQNDILTKVDRATMSVSLEGREPLVDHRIVEFAAQLPVDFKRDARGGKKILKDIVHQYVPKEMLERPKSGFSLPIYSWLKGDLAYLIEEYLNKEALERSGCWNVPFCLAQVNQFKKGTLHYSPFIWYLLMFQMWFKRWMH